MLAAQGERHMLGVARGLTYRNGFHDQSAEIWGQDGQLLATTHQMVYFRD
jgi:acyl-CoA thioesterase